MKVNNKLFLARMMCVVNMLKENRYPNYSRVTEEMRKLDIDKSYNVKSRAVQKDISFLKSELNAPIAYDRSKKGYYLTDDKWNLDFNLINENMKANSSISMRLAEMINPAAFHETIPQTKNSAVVSRTILDDKSQLLAMIATGAKVAVSPEFFETVFNGWRTRHTLTISYKQECDDREIELLVEPHVIGTHDGCWYFKVRVLQFDGVAHKERHVTTLAIHRIKRAVVNTNTFSIDPEISESSNNGKLFNFPTVKNAVLKLTGDSVEYGPQAFVYSLLNKKSHGSIEITIPEVEEYKIINFVLNWLGEAQVIAPVELVKKIHASAAKIRDLHKC